MSSFMPTRRKATGKSVGFPVNNGQVGRYKKKKKKKKKK